MFGIPLAGLRDRSYVKCHVDDFAHEQVVVGLLKAASKTRAR